MGPKFFQSVIAPLIPQNVYAKYFVQIIQQIAYLNCKLLFDK